MRFRRRIKVFPGFSLNLSGSGVSGTFGIPGASVNVGRGGSYLNTGIPGTGLYDRQRLGGNARNTGAQDEAGRAEHTMPPGDIPVAESAAMDALTTEHFNALRNSLEEAYRDRVELSAEMRRQDGRIKRARTLWVFSCILLVGFVLPWFRRRIADLRTEREEMEKQWESEKVEIAIVLHGPAQALYDECRTAFEELMQSEMCWDAAPVMSGHVIKVKKEKRIPIALRLHELRIIQTDYPAFHLENKNGADLYFYPGFVVLISREKEFALIDFSGFSVAFGRERHAETGAFPSDAAVVDQQWIYANKDGSRDRRYKDNVQLPVVEYGRIQFTSVTGLKEDYLFSNADAAERFARAFHVLARSISVTSSTSST